MASALPTPLRLDPKHAEQMIGIGLDVLHRRTLLWLVTLGAGGIWAVAVLHPEILRIIAATLYSGVVVWPVLWADVKGGA